MTRGGIPLNEFHKQFGFEQTTEPHGISLQEYMESTAFLKSFPNPFSISCPSYKTLNRMEKFKLLVNFVQKQKDHPVFIDLYFPVFMLLLMEMKESAPDEIPEFTNAYIHLMPENAQNNAKRAIEDDEVFRYYASRLATINYVIKITDKESDILNEFVNSDQNYPIRHYITDHISPWLLRNEGSELTPTFEVKPPDSIGNLSFVQIFIKDSRLATVSRTTPAYYAAFDDCSVRRFDTKTHKSEILHFHRSAVTSMSLSSTSSLLLTTDLDGTANIWSSGGRQHQTQLSESAVLCSAFAPKGGVFASGAADALAVAYDCSELRPFRAFVAHRDAVTSIGFHPSCALIGTTSADRSARVWDVRSAESVRVFPAARLASNICFSPDGSLAAFYDGDLRVVNIGSGQNVTTRAFDGGQLAGLFFTNDSGALIAVQRGGATRVLTFGEGASLKPLVDLEAQVAGVGIDMENTIIAVTSE